MRWIWLGLALAMAGTSCASTQEKAKRTEDLLAAAGFRQKIATTPEQKEHLQSLEQRKLVAHQRDDGQMAYVYADAQGCNCIWVGDAEAYQHYQQMAHEARIAEEQREAAEAQEDAAMDWGVWGPWWW